MRRIQCETFLRLTCEPSNQAISAGTRTKTGQACSRNEPGCNWDKTCWHDRGDPQERVKYLIAFTISLHFACWLARQP